MSKALGGDIFVDSIVWKGSVFTLKITQMASIELSDRSIIEEFKP